MNKFCNIKFIIMSIFIDIILVSCNILTFEKIKIDCNVESNKNYFYEEELILRFTLKPELLSLEKIVTLKCDGKNQNIEINKLENKFVIKPVNNWKKGFNYQLIIDGTLNLVDGGSFDVFLQRDFIYGLENKQLFLSEYTNPEKTELGLIEPISFVFNQSVDTVSFIDGFSINPFCETRIIFNEDNTRVQIFPVDKWSRNTFYEWKLSEIISSENYILYKKHNDFFETCSVSDLPELIKVCPVDFSNSNYFWHLESELNGTIRDKQCIGFIFSEPMEFESVASAINFSPVMKGSLICVENNPLQYIWRPSSNWEIDTLYNLKISESACDLEGKNLFSSKDYFFKTFNQFLQVSKIDYKITSTDETVICNVDLTFSSPISTDSLVQTVESISFKPFFPITLSNPYLEEVKWNETNTIASFQWRGFSKSSETDECFYKLVISGGKNGCKNTAGEYLKEDVCEIIKIQ